MRRRSRVVALVGAPGVVCLAIVISLRGPAGPGRAASAQELLLLHARDSAPNLAAACLASVAPFVIAVVAPAAAASEIGLDRSSGALDYLRTTAPSRAFLWRRLTSAWSITLASVACSAATIGLVARWQGPAGTVRAADGQRLDPTEIGYAIATGLFLLLMVALCTCTITFALCLRVPSATALSITFAGYVLVQVGRVLPVLGDLALMTPLAYSDAWVYRLVPDPDGPGTRVGLVLAATWTACTALVALAVERPKRRTSEP